MTNAIVTSYGNIKHLKYLLINILQAFKFVLMCKKYHTIARFYNV